MYFLCLPGGVPCGSGFAALFFACFILVDALRGHTTLFVTRKSVRRWRWKQTEVLLHARMGYAFFLTDSAILQLH